MNKNVKKVFSVFLCVIMIISVFSVAGYAESEPLLPEISLECNLDEINVGDEFEVYVTLKNVKDVEKVTLLWNLNPDALELVMVTNPFPFNYIIGTQSKYHYSFSFREPFNGDVYVMRMVLIAKKEGISTIEMWVNEWNDKIASDGFDYSIVPQKAKYDVAVQKKETRFNCTFSEKDIDIGELINVYVSVKNCVDVTGIKAYVYFDTEHFEFYNLQEEVFRRNVYNGSGRCSTEMSVHIMDDHIYGDQDLLVFSFRAIKSGKSDISVEVVDWYGENKPANAKFPITVSDKVYVDNFKYDVNLDGKITATDARLALRTAAQIDTLIGKNFEAADIDKNGMITAADARLILRKSAKLD